MAKAHTRPGGKHHKSKPTRRVQLGSVVERHKDLSYLLPHSFGRARPEVTSVEEGAPGQAQAEGRAAGGAKQQPARVQQTQKQRQQGAGKSAGVHPGKTKAAAGVTSIAAATTGKYKRRRNVGQNKMLNPRHLRDCTCLRWG